MPLPELYFTGLKYFFEIFILMAVINKLPLLILLLLVVKLSLASRSKHPVNNNLALVKGKFLDNSTNIVLGSEDSVVLFINLFSLRQLILIIIIV
jgi:hypothetical protein